MKKSLTKLDWCSRAMLSLLGAFLFGVFFFTIRQARRDIQAHSPEEKTRFQTVFPGVEAASDLERPQRKQVIARANQERCVCRCGYTVASCLKFDSRCPLRPKNFARIVQLVREARAAP